MLSDEEKKEYIEHEILDRLYCLEENDFDKNKVDDGYIQAVLNACKEAKNLIEKQSKEIDLMAEEIFELQYWVSYECSTSYKTVEDVKRLFEERCK